jgi:hypothetical protein
LTGASVGTDRNLNNDEGYGQAELNGCKPVPCFLQRDKRGKETYMNTDKITIATARAEQPDFVKRIGNTTYRVRVYFNPNSKETMSDKVLRLIKNDPAAFSQKSYN